MHWEKNMKQKTGLTTQKIANILMMKPIQNSWMDIMKYAKY